MQTLNSNSIRTFFLLLFMVLCGMVFGQNNDLSKKQIGALTQEIINTLADNYIIPDLKKRLTTQLKTNLDNGKYDHLTSSSQYAKALTKELQTLSGDFHLYLLEKEGDKGNLPAQRRMVRSIPDPNAFKNILKFEKLPGNIAFIEIPMFGPLEYAKEGYDKVLKETTSADAIIFDVRRCRGGAGDAMAYIVGSFIENPTHLTTYYSKNGSSKSMSAKTEYGSINKDKEVYILSDYPNGSAGEGFAFYTQQIGRTKVIGQTSKGAGRSNSLFNLSEGFTLSVSTRTSVTPNGKQFQGIGVVPDIFTVASQAKTQAHLLALSSLREKHPEKAASYEQVIKEVAQKVDKNSSKTLNPKDQKSIENTVLGYIENFFENKTDEMLSYLHPQLAKRGISKKKGQEGLYFEDMSMDQLKTMLARKPAFPKEKQQNKVEILDAFSNTASVKLHTGYPGRMEWIEYIHLCKLNGEWKISNVIWDYYPSNNKTNQKRRKSK